MWYQKYIGKDYKSCAHLARDIQEKEFKKYLDIELDELMKEDFSCRHKIISDLQPTYTIKIDESDLQDGDLVLLNTSNIRDHIGTIAMHNNAPHCLHLLRPHLGVLFHRVKIMKLALAITIEGYYRINPTSR